MAATDIAPDMTTLTLLPNTGQGRRGALRYLKALQDRARGAKAAARAQCGRAQADMERARAECRLMQWVYEHYFLMPPEPAQAHLEVAARVRQRAGGWPTYSAARWIVTAQYLLETFAGAPLLEGREEAAFVA